MIKKLAALALAILTTSAPDSYVAWADRGEKTVAPVSMDVSDVGVKTGPMDRATTAIVKFDSGRLPRLMDRSLPLLRRVFGVSPSRQFSSPSVAAAFGEAAGPAILNAHEMPVADIKEGESRTHAPRILDASGIAVRHGAEEAGRVVRASAEEQQALLKNLGSGRGDGASARAASGRPFGEEISRRKFLTGLGIVAGAAAVGTCVGGCTGSNYTPPPPTPQVSAFGYLDVTSVNPAEVVDLFNNGFADNLAGVDVVYTNDNLFVAHQAFNPNATNAYFRTGVPSGSDYSPLRTLKPFKGTAGGIASVFSTLASLPIDLAVAAKVMTLQDYTTWIMFHPDPFYVFSPYSPSAWIHWLTSPNWQDIVNTLNVIATKLSVHSSS